MTDTIETVNGSVFQHGHHNDRIYLMRLNLNDIKGSLAALDELAKEKGYGKVFARIPFDAWSDFQTAGYRKEAVIPGFYRRCTDGLFVARYYSPRRQVLSNMAAIETLLAYIKKKTSVINLSAGQPPLPVTQCGSAETGEISTVFQTVFKSYPFPIHESVYIDQAMKNGVAYYCVRANGGIAALAAAEIDRESETVEMTDFATLPDWRGSGMAAALLKHMENKTRKLGIKTTYTIARATSHGINRLFKSNGYTYAGLLINNTQICGSIQSMTVWYKHS